MPDRIAGDLRRSRREPGAFVAVFAALSPQVLVHLTRRTFDVEVARDLTAETFAQAFEHRGRFRGRTDGEAAGWVFAIAGHQLARYARRGRVERKAVRRLALRIPAVAEDDQSRIEELAGLAGLRGAVADAFDELAPEQRDAVRLRVVDELPDPEVAAALGVSEPTARARVSRGLRRLAAALDAHATTEVTP